jgi:hypothetical protein
VVRAPADGSVVSCSPPLSALLAALPLTFRLDGVWRSCAVFINSCVAAAVRVGWL